MSRTFCPHNVDVSEFTCDVCDPAAAISALRTHVGELEGRVEMLEATVEALKEMLAAQAAENSKGATP